MGRNRNAKAVSGKENVLIRTAELIRTVPERSARRKKKLKRLYTAAGAAVVILNLWKDHKEAIFRKK